MTNLNMAAIFPAGRFLTPAVLACVFGLLVVIERLLPLRRRTRRAAGRVLTNLLISGVGFAAGGLVVRPMALGLINWSAGSRFGLLHIIPLPAPLQYAVGILLMDLTFYYWHRLTHEIGVLWRLHSVHHLDPDMDVTTSFRFHAVEILASTGMRAAQVVLLGVSAPIYVAYEIVFQILTLFHHSNLRLPVRVERVVNLLFVTPRMHGVHHSVVRREVNSNYSVILRLWDQLHRTLILNVPQACITIGVAAYSEPADNSFVRLLLMPFRRQRSVPDSPTEHHGPPTLMSE